MEKYTYIKEAFSYTVIHTEGKVKTMIAVTDSAEKAHSICNALNNVLDLSDISRVELINHHENSLLKGGVYHFGIRQDIKVDLDLQDNDRTLKIFISKK